MDVRLGLWRKLSAEELMLLNCGVGEDSFESLGLQGHPTSPFWRRSALGFLWREWCWSWNSSTLATWCEELTHWKRLWCWEGLGAGGEEDNRGWNGWMASLTQWTWIWVNSGSWWWTGRPGVLRLTGSQRVGHDWATELNWLTDHSFICVSVHVFTTPWTEACESSLSFSVSQNLLKFMSTESVMPSNHFVLSHPLLFLPLVFPSIRVFSSESLASPSHWLNLTRSQSDENPVETICENQPLGIENDDVS